MTTARPEDARDFTKQSSYGTAETSDVSFASDDGDLDPAKDSEYSNSKWTVAALSLCMLTNSYLLISVFPYAGLMAIGLLQDANEENAGSYACLMASMFMIGRSLSAYSWGKIAGTDGSTFASIQHCSPVLHLPFSLAWPRALEWRSSGGFVLDLEMEWNG
ncbi:Major Facilitator superfamily [Seminavis robusta]|uniref:Major Facilitator superfamily n=1 Tax=Seminavis robusta TaxID=568900 RepID=A0A9N8E798_9STRA|nr:Major Facilitator superfamily [Seminavis robusta]|eukprot:Sro741_g195810.1 Major Facilitator superfamily (161) ;mRNA; r:48665-49147